MGVVENMEVKSEASTEVAKARSQVQEFLLLNHPVDCPICDQAGECRLQDYWLEHQGTKKRMHDEPVHKPKGVVFGPTIVYDAERCIVCTRCVRFSAEIAKDPVLDERERGNLTEIVVSPGRQLDHDYTLMTEYVCPVGALTSSDFRFKARVWFLRSARTICTGCATGCNAYLDYDPRTMTPYRHRPRENMAVNQYWMCDEGMLSYHRLTEKRVHEPREAGQPTSMPDALEKVRRLFAGAPKDQIAVVLSAQHSNEDNFALYKLANTFIGASTSFISGRPEGKRDEILIHQDKNPNTAGVRALAPQARSFDELLESILAGRITHVIALGSDVPGDPSLLEAPLGKLKALVTLASHDGTLARAAHVVLPACAWAEAEGTYVNSRGMAQKSERAYDAKGLSRPAWDLIARVGEVLGYATSWRKLKEVRRAMEPEEAAAGS
jgi:NADH-quinone oxidoreductase subunit G